MERRICTKCKKDFIANLKNFKKNKKGKYGLSSTCIKCHNEWHRIYRLSNEKKIKDNNEKYRNENPNYDKEYGLKNKTKIQIQKKKYILENIKLVKKYHKEYKRRNAEKYRNLGQLYRDRLADPYIKSLFNSQGISNDRINSEIIETKRLIVKIKRELWKQN